MPNALRNRWGRWWPWNQVFDRGKNHGREGRALCVEAKVVVIYRLGSSSIIRRRVEFLSWNMIRMAVKGLQNT